MFDGIHGGCGEDTTMGVGSKSPEGNSRDDIRDMAGNVDEWTDSWYNGDVGTARVARGGSWNDSAGALETSSQRALDPDSGDSPYVGFRCVQSPT
jgi:formylglycine-generating enzyme required for sulfatase activity